MNDISGNIEAVFLKLGIINVHHKRAGSGRGSVEVEVEVVVEVV